MGIGPTAGLMPRLVLSALAGLLPAVAMAETYVSNPGLCDAPDAEQELAMLAYLGAEEISSHGVTCWWTEAPQTFEVGRTARIGARCDDGARQWETQFTVSVDTRGRVDAFADSSTGLPEYYFSCASWGWKGDAAAAAD